MSTHDPEVLLGIDIGGTKCVVAAGYAGGEILAETRLERWTSGSAERDLETLAETTREVMAAASVAAPAVRALGLSAPGPLDPVAGVVHEAPNLPGWVAVRVRERLARALEVPVRLENDANAAALAEWRFGAGRGASSVLFLTMSTGVGAGMVLDGGLHRGRHFLAGEVGHIPVAPGGRACNCGLRGCLEAYTGGAAIATRIREDLERGQGASLLERANGDPAGIDARLWVEAVREDDAYALGIYTEFLDQLAQGLAILVPLLDPERIVLGTIVQRNPDLFLDPLRQRVRERIWKFFPELRILAGELGPRLPALAALAVAALEGAPGSRP